MKPKMLDIYKDRFIFDFQSFTFLQKLKICFFVILGRQIEIRVPSGIDFIINESINETK